MLIAKADAETVRRRVAALPIPFREVLVLREIHELGYKEIAEIAGVRSARSCRGCPAPVSF